MIIDFFEYSNGSGGGLNIIFLTPAQTDEHGVPIIENPDTKSIYFAKPKPEIEEGSNLYNEWVWIKPEGVGGQWELFGTASIDIKNLVRKVNGIGPDITGNVVVTTNQKFLDTFVTNSTTEAFCESVKTYGQLGMSYIGPLSCTDLPSGLGNGEAVVEVIGTTLDPNGKVIHIYLYSTTTSPYAWEYSYYNSEKKSGWTYYNGYTKGEVDNLLNGKADKATTLAGYNIGDAKIENGTITLGSNSIKPVKSVNSNGPDDNGNVNITTFSDVPLSMNPYKTNHTTSEFCKKFLEIVQPPTGSAYLTGGICFSDMPKSFFINSQGQGGTASCELMIYVPSTGCLLLEIDTTNNFTQKWQGEPGKFRAIYDVGTQSLKMAWTGSLTCPQSSELIGEGTDKEFKFIPAKDSDAVSKYWFDKNAVKSVNKITPDDQGDVTVRTFSELPDTVIKNTTLHEFLKTLREFNPVGGTAYLTEANFSGCPLSMQGGNFELYIYVPVSGIYLLEISSLDSFESFDGNVPGKWVAIDAGDTVEDPEHPHEIEYEICVLRMGWKGMMSCPQVNIGTEENPVYKYIPNKDSDGASKYYVDNHHDSSKITKPEGGVAGQVLTTDGEGTYTWTNKTEVVNDTTHTDTNKALSANMGKELQTQVNNLKNIGRFLAIWDASTGAPTSEPTTSPYTYKVGDYYRVGVAGTKNPASNLTYVTGGVNWQTGDALEIGDVVYCSNVTASATTWVRQASSGGGAVQDVQVGGVSVLSSGIANVPIATSSANGAMSSTDKSKLDGIESGADVTDATNVAAAGAVMTTAQSLTTEQKTQARSNIGAGTPIAIQILEGGDV